MSDKLSLLLEYVKADSRVCSILTRTLSDSCTASGSIRNFRIAWKNLKRETWSETKERPSSDSKKSMIYVISTAQQRFSINSPGINGD